MTIQRQNQICSMRLDVATHDYGSHYLRLTMCTGTAGSLQGTQAREERGRTGGTGFGGGISVSSRPQLLEQVCVTEGPVFGVGAGAVPGKGVSGSLGMHLSEGARCCGGVGLRVRATAGRGASGHLGGAFCGGRCRCLQQHALCHSLGGSAE